MTPAPRPATFAFLNRLLAVIFRGDQGKRLIALVSTVMGLAFLAVAVLSYGVSRERMHDFIASKELPLTSGTLHAEIQHDFAVPIRASALMASNTFLREWATGGEKDVGEIQKYLAEMQRVNAAFTAYFVSGLSHKYYNPKGILKTLSTEDSHDVWFFDLARSTEPYVVQVDTDQTHDNALTIFINYRVRDENNTFIGMAGIGLNFDAVRASLDHFQRQFDSEIYFVDRSGRVMMFGEDSRGDRELFENIYNVPGLAQLAPGILAGKTGAMEYDADDGIHLLNVRYMPELDWYLFVERDEDAALSGIRRTFYINLVIATLATALVAAVLAVAVTRFRAVVDRIATTDDLTGLINRRAFGILYRQAVKAIRRGNQRLSMVLFDIDNFSQINAQFGHAAGDQVIKAVAAAIDARSRPNDIVCRWGGEEILLVLQDCGLDKAMSLADDVRLDIERLQIAAGAKPVSVTVSAGLAEVFPDEGEQSAIGRADQGLAAAKRAGRNRIISSGRF